MEYILVRNTVPQDFMQEVNFRASEGFAPEGDIIIAAVRIGMEDGRTTNEYNLLMSRYVGPNE